MQRLRIATRRSRLALAQAQWIARLLARLQSDLEVGLVERKTQGDVILDRPLHDMESRGVFTREIDQVLLAGEADCAVHSLKDLPTMPVPGLVLAAVPERADTGDLLAGCTCASFSDLPTGAVIGTGALRRRAQLLRLRPDLRVVEVRGNVETRLRRCREQGWSGTVLAAAGLKRLGLEDVPTCSLAAELLPAPGQGALGIVAREEDADTRQLLARIEDARARIAVTAERGFLAATGAGCHAPLGVRSRLGPAPEAAGSLELEGAVFTIDGKEEARATIAGTAGNARELGEELAKRILDQGGAGILARSPKGEGRT